ncbi:MAG: hypothetical protein FRX49_10624 [Trebouxia sp. A1-2]|nr:MAG: hypothetical protein FRX49_10624 [Trebouxia sp. A1-2]
MEGHRRKGTQVRPEHGFDMATSKIQVSTTYKTFLAEPTPDYVQQSYEHGAIRAQVLSAVTWVDDADSARDAGVQTGDGVVKDREVDSKERGSLPVTYDIGGLRCGTSQVGGAFAHPQNSLPNQLDGWDSPSGGSSYGGAFNTNTKTSTAEQYTISGECKLKQ